MLPLCLRFRAEAQALKENPTHTTEYGYELYEDIRASANRIFNKSQDLKVVKVTNGVCARIIRGVGLVAYASGNVVEIDGRHETRMRRTDLIRFARSVETGEALGLRNIDFTFSGEPFLMTRIVRTKIKATFHEVNYRRVALLTTDGSTEEDFEISLPSVEHLRPLQHPIVVKAAPYVVTTSSWTLTARLVNPAGISHARLREEYSEKSRPLINTPKQLTRGRLVI
jgi:hypothetical protein